MKNIHKYQHRYQIIALLHRGFFTVPEAAWDLGISARHVRRLLAKFRENQRSFSALAPKSRPPAWNGLTQKIVDEILRLKKENPKRSNPHIAEFVENKSLKKISPSTVRKVLIRNDCYEKTKRERRVFKRLEETVTRSGQMVQMDTCEGVWLKGYRRVYLIAAMDAFSRYIVGWKWVDSDSAWNNILVLRSVIEQYGVPEILYTDNASFFKVIRHNQSRFQRHKPEEEYETRIERILLELGSVLVTHKPYEPQGKGRLERFFRFMQDRFIEEHTAKNLTELNKQFKSWVRWYNTRHVIRTTSSTPKDRLDPEGFKPIPKDFIPEKVFCYHHIRRVDKYNGFSFGGDEYVIDSKNCREWSGCLTFCRVDLCVTPQTITVYYQGKRIKQFKNRSRKLR